MHFQRINRLLAVALVLGALTLAAPVPAGATTGSFALYLPGAMRNPVTAPAGPCSPGRTITDPANDNPLAHVDVLDMTGTLNGSELRVTLHLRDVPEVLEFNKAGVPSSRIEMEWSVYIDVDNDPATGASYAAHKGAEFQISAFYAIATGRAPFVSPIEQAVTAKVWMYRYDLVGWFCQYGPATVEVDPVADTLTLTGIIPGINPGSRLFFATYDHDAEIHPQWDRSSCAVGGSAAAEPAQTYDNGELGPQDE